MLKVKKYKNGKLLRGIIKKKKKSMCIRQLDELKSVNCVRDTRAERLASCRGESTVKEVP